MTFTAENGSNGKWEELLTRHVMAPKILPVPPLLLTGLCLTP